MKKTGLIEGWGVNDVPYSVHKVGKVNGKKKLVWTCPYYMDWVSILKRCLSQKFHEIQPTYIGCTICEEWKYLSNFIKWVDSQPNKGWMNCHLDKDLLVYGNKHYSPDTVVYIDGGLNRFVTDCTRSRGSCMLGVSLYSSGKAHPYKAQCRDPFTLKQEYLGAFPTELEAHLAWKDKKHEHACKLADLQSDERVAKRLREMYTEAQDLTAK